MKENVHLVRRINNQILGVKKKFSCWRRQQHYSILVLSEPLYRAVQREPSLQFFMLFSSTVFMVEVVYIHTVYLYFIGKIRVFFKVLSSQSFLKVNRCGSKGPIQWAFPASFSHNYNYVHISKTSYCSYFLAITVRFIKRQFRSERF